MGEKKNTIENVKKKERRASPGEKVNGYRVYKRLGILYINLSRYTSISFSSNNYGSWMERELGANNSRGSRKPMCARRSDS